MQPRKTKDQTTVLQVVSSSFFFSIIFSREGSVFKKMVVWCTVSFISANIPPIAVGHLERCPILQLWTSFTSRGAQVERFTVCFL